MDAVINPDHVFAALADATRRDIVLRALDGREGVAELAAHYPMSFAAVQKHVAVLERAGLISSNIDAQRRPRRIEAAPLAEANEWLENYRRFWEARYQRLDTLLEEMKADEAKKRRRRVSSRTKK